jgi:hypothetical protein
VYGSHNFKKKIMNDKLSPSDGFEMDESFGIKSKNKTKDEDYEFPMQIPYIAKMQDKDKSLKKELMKINNTYELTKIERTLVLTIEGNIFYCDRDSTKSDRLVTQIPLSLGRYAYRSYDPRHHGMARINWKCTIVL